jgi:hypothetical protein
MSGRRLAFLAALLGAAAVLVAGCGAGKPTSAAVSTTKTPHLSAPPKQAAAPRAANRPAVGTCVAVPPSLNRAILSHVVLGDARFVKVWATRAANPASFYYVSAALAGDGTRHLLATWVTNDLGGHEPIYSVDANAALVSLYGASTEKSLSLSIDAPAAYRSRTCVDGRHAGHGAPAPLSGGGAPAGQ